MTMWLWRQDVQGCRRLPPEDRAPAPSYSPETSASRRSNRSTVSEKMRAFISVRWLALARELAASLLARFCLRDRSLNLSAIFRARPILERSRAGVRRFTAGEKLDSTSSISALLQTSRAFAIETAIISPCRSFGSALGQELVVCGAEQ